MPKHPSNLKFDPESQTQLHAVKTSDLIMMLVSPQGGLSEVFVFDDEGPAPFDGAREARLAAARIAIAAEIDRRIPVD